MKTWPPSPTIALVGRAVAVVLPAPAVEVDHPPDVVRGQKMLLWKKPSP